MLEKRKPHHTKKVALPREYIQLLEQTCLEYFSSWVHQQHPTVNFCAWGDLYTDELVIAVSIQRTPSPSAELSGVAVHLSADFNEKTDIHEILHISIDAIAGVFEELFHHTSQTLFMSNLDEIIELCKVPAVWKAVKTNIFVRVDKMNIQLELMADKLLNVQTFVN